MSENIILTGATGFLGTVLVNRIMDYTDYTVEIIVRNRGQYENFINKIGNEYCNRIGCIEINSLSPADIKDNSIVVHMAFSRRNKSDEEIASSIDYSSKIFEIMKKTKISKLINISTQGVYGDKVELRYENTTVSPSNIYTMAKYATERLLDTIMHDTGIQYTSLRVDLVVQSQRIVSAFCKQAIEGKISIKGGNQIFSFIDAEDVADAILAAIRCRERFQKVYNVGWNNSRVSIVELANAVADIALRLGFKRPEIEISYEDIILSYGMNSELFMKQMEWNPKIDLEMMIEKVFKSLI